MATILDTIVRDTRACLGPRRRDMPLSRLEDQPEFAPERRSFFDALAADGLGVIAECKHRSPSKGLLTDSYDPASIARAYQRAGAAAVSVLTEPKHFGGSTEHLATVRASVDLPLLRKDFIVDPYQIVEARAFGADAVLLIATVLERSQLAELHEAALEYGLDALVELYDVREFDRVDPDQVSIIGVNSRDLNTFDVDVSEAVQVLESLPEGILRVAESGISSESTLLELQQRGIDAALIGEAFMTAPHPGDALRHFTDALQSARTSSHRSDE